MLADTVTPYGDSFERVLRRRGFSVGAGADDVALGGRHGFVAKEFHVYPAGPELAADILDDSLAADRPHDRRRLIQVALRILNGPIPQDPTTLAEQLSAATDTAGRTQGLSVASTNADRLFVRDVLREAFAGGPAAYEIAATLVYYGSFGGAALPSGLQVLGCADTETTHSIDTFVWA